MFRIYSLSASLLTVWVFCQPLFAAAAEPAPVPAAAVAWQTDYARATRDAQRQGKMLVIFFFDAADQACRRFEAETLGDAAVAARLKKDFVCLRLPQDARVRTSKGEVKLIEHASFSEMLGRPGIAMIDFAHADPNLHGYVTSTFPLTSTLQYTPQQMLVILDLPAGTLTQRTLIYAVRVHPRASGQHLGPARSAPGCRGTKPL